MTQALRPGGHVFIASNTFLSQLVFASLVEGGLEFRGEIIRLVRTLRGGDRPKNAEEAFPEVSSLPRGCYEPWGLLRKPLPRGMRVSDCLKTFQTGGLRRTADGHPFGTGIIADPFMGSGSTVAAAEATGVTCIGVELAADYYAMSRVAIPRLAALTLAPKAKRALDPDMALLEMPTLFDF